MTSKFASTLIIFAVVVVATLAGVLLFFQPISANDQSILELHPILGLLIYTGLCTWIYLWAFKLTSNSYRAALVLILPQAALIIDLALRGERGIITAIAGISLLLATWFLVAYVHSIIARKRAQHAPGE